MFNAPIIGGEGDAPTPIRLRALSLGAGVQPPRSHRAVAALRGAA